MSKNKVPILNIPLTKYISSSDSPGSKLSDSSSEDVIHECINNMDIRYEVKKSNDYVITSDELKYEQKLYKYKKELARRNIKLIISEEDLKKCHKDNSEILYLRLSLCSSESCKKTSRSAPNSLREPNDEIKHTARKSTSNRSRTNSLAKNKDSCTIEKLTKQIKLSDKEYIINYIVSIKTYNVFKIENTDQLISCYGILDNEVYGNTLVNYDIKEVFYGEHKYEIMISPSFNNFCPYMIITSTKNQNIENFMNILQDIINSVNF
jgi:hypothetical protein